MNKQKTNKLIEDIIRCQKDYHLLPSDKDGICVYDGSLDCSGNQLSNLPINLKVGGNLYCEYNQLTTLPDGLVVKGNLYCYYNQLYKLPDGLRVGGSLNCNNNQLTSIPNDLYVGGYLNCSYNNITKEIKANIGDVTMDDEQQHIYDRVVKLNRLMVKIDE